MVVGAALSADMEDPTRPAAIVVHGEAIVKAPGIGGATRVLTFPADGGALHDDVGKGKSAMPDKVAAWMRQSEHDLEHARAALAAGIYDWACRAAGEAAEKAIKAVLLPCGGRVLGSQNLLLLLERARNEAGVIVSEDLAEDARDLMQVLGILAGQCTYNGVAPFELISRAQAEGAIAAAERIRACMGARAAVA